MFDPVINLRLLRQEDIPALLTWFNAPHVIRWWDGPLDLENIKAKYMPRLADNSPTRVYVIEIDKKPIGLIQCYRHADYPQWNQLLGIERAVGIDYLIGDENYIGKGIASSAIYALSKIIFATYHDIDVIVSDPAAENKQSWRALEKAGFKRIDERRIDAAEPSYIYILQNSLHNN